MRIISYILSVIASMILIACTLFGSVRINAFDIGFYKDEYTKLGVTTATNMQLDDLMGVTRHLLDYVRGSEDSLDFKAKIGSKERTVFDERERDHMVDVQALYLNARTLSLFGIVISAIMFITSFLLARKDGLRVLAKSYLIGCAVMGVLCGALGAWIYVDFSSFWTSFHLLVFTNDLWLLDPATSILINMVPLQFFFDLVENILITFAAVAGGLAVACAGYLTYRVIKRKKPLEIREQGEE